MPSDLPIAELTNESPLARIAAVNAIADAVEEGTPLGADAPAIVALLDSDELAPHAMFILQTDAERDPAGEGANALRAGIADPNPTIRRLSAKLLAGGLARREAGTAVAELVGHADLSVRAGAISAIADGAIPHAEQSPLVTALIAALADPVLAKDAVWALYLVGSDGASIDAAVPALERALAEIANAAIPLALVWQLADDPRLATLEADANYMVQMGAAWGRADAHLRRGDLARLRAMYTAESIDLRRGLGAFLWDARKRGRDLALAGRAFAELETEYATDPAMLARIHAVLQIVKLGPDA